MVLVCAASAGAWARPLRVLPLGDSLTYGCGDQCDPAANCTHPPAYRHDVISVLGKNGLKGSHYHPGQTAATTRYHAAAARPATAASC